KVAGRGSSIDDVRDGHGRQSRKGIGAARGGGVGGGRSRGTRLVGGVGKTAEEGKGGGGLEGGVERQRGDRFGAGGN
ncbi:hypothetical protein C7A09_28455, partial [Pseudomonas fluorescens]